MATTPPIANLNKRRIRKSFFRHHLHIDSYGVRIRVSSNDGGAIVAITDMLPAYLADRYSLISAGEANHDFFYIWNKSRRDSLYKESDMVGIRREREGLLDQLGSYLRLTVAEFAVDTVFVHAGVVSWKGKAILLPAKTFSGKSTLTSELVRLGALYYSDEYAVFDKDGLVSPFPKMLSIRGIIDDKQSVNLPVEAFGGKAGTASIPVGMILATKYKRSGKWNPHVLSKSSGIVELIKNALSIRTSPSFNLSVLERATKNAVIVRSPRGEAADTAPMILEFFEERVCDR